MQATANKGLGDFPKVNPTEEVTSKGIAVLLSFFVAYFAIYALSYPLGRLSGNSLLGVPLSSPFSLICLVLTFVGMWIILRHRKDYNVNDVAVAFIFAALVWLAIQSKYWYYGRAPSIPYYDPTFNGVEVFLMTMGAIGLLKGHKVLRFRLAEDDDPGAAKSAVTGIVMGLPFAALNILMFVLFNGQPLVPRDVIYSAVVALQPGIMEELVFRLFFMGLAIVVLLKYLPRNWAIVSAIFMAVLFHSALHVSQTIVVSPLSAVITVAVTGILFGLPMACLAYKKDIETAIGFHWVIDAIRFTLGA